MDDALIALALAAGEVHFNTSEQQQQKLSDSDILDTGDSVDGIGVSCLFKPSEVGSSDTEQSPGPLVAVCCPAPSSVLVLHSAPSFPARGQEAGS